MHSRARWGCTCGGHPFALCRGLDRAPDNASLYPGRFVTGICPDTLFDLTPVYREGDTPDEEETQNASAPTGSLITGNYAR